MKRYALRSVRTLTFLPPLIILFFSSCKEEDKASVVKTYDPSRPISLTSFYPVEGGARDKILLDGENFGTDASKIKVYFNNVKASVVSSSGERIYAIVPRLPGDEPRISVVLGADSAVYENSYTYRVQAQVSTVTGNGEPAFQSGALSDAQVSAKYLELDAEGNIFMSWRDGGSFGVARINEQQNIVTPLYYVENTSDRVLYANGLTVDRETGVLTASHESVVDVFFSFDPREAWYPRQRNTQFAMPHGIPNGDQYMNFVSFSPYDGMLYTRSRDGSVVKIHPDTYEATVVHNGSRDAGSKWPYGSQYGQAINPARPWELWMTLHSNAVPNEYRQGLMMLDLRPEHIHDGFKRVNAVGGSAFRDGPLAEALFSLPKDIKFDNDGNLFVADFGNHCIRMVSPDAIVTTVAGQPANPGYKDGGPIESQFREPWGVAVNEQGDIYIADFGNKRVRKLVIE